MKNIPLWLVTALVATIGFSTTAQAEDDAAALVQRARVLEEVDKDVDKARALYARAWEAGKASDAGFRAGMRLVLLLPRTDTGRRALLADLTKLHAERMSDAQKQQVHDAMAAMLQPGQHVKTPLGTVFVREEVEPDDKRSPVEQQLQRIFEAHKIRTLPFLPNNEAAYRDVDRELRTLGAPARAALQRLVEAGQPDEAFSAAIVLGRLDPAAALTGYARAMAEGRAQFRRRVMMVASRLKPQEDVSKALVLEFLPLLELEDIQDLHKSLVYEIAEHMSKEQLLAQAKKKGPWQVTWLDRASRRDFAEAVPPLVELVAAGDGGSTAIQVLNSAVGRQDRSGNSWKWSLPLESLETTQVNSLFVTLLASGTAPNNAQQVFRRMARILFDRKQLDPLAHELWRRVLAEPSSEKRARLISIAGQVGSGDVPPLRPPEAIFKTEADFTRLAQSLSRFGTKTPADWMKGSVPLWKAALHEIQHGQPSNRSGAVRGVANFLKVVPEGAYAEALALFESDAFKDRLDHMHEWLWRGAAKTADPRFLKRMFAMRDWQNWYGVRHRSASALSDYRAAGGPGLTQFAADVLQHPRMRLADWAIRYLRADEDPRGWAHIVAIAQDPSQSAAYTLVKQIDIRDPRQRTVLTGLFQMAEIGDNEFWSGQKSLGLRQILVRRAGELRLKEAVPFLIREYETRDLAPEKRNAVVAALDAIRDHHERLAFFKTWSAGKADAEREVRAMLADPSPTIRRAAVLSWGTLVGPRGLSDLLKIAKHDQDTDVRAAALQAIERIAAAQSATPPRAPSPKPGK